MRLRDFFLLLVTFLVVFFVVGFAVSAFSHHSDPPLGDLTDSLSSSDETDGQSQYPSGSDTTVEDEPGVSNDPATSDSEIPVNSDSSDPDDSSSPEPEASGSEPESSEPEVSGSDPDASEPEVSDNEPESSEPDSEPDLDVLSEYRIYLQNGGGYSFDEAESYFDYVPGSSKELHVILNVPSQINIEIFAELDGSYLFTLDSNYYTFDGSIINFTIPEELFDGLPYTLVLEISGVTTSYTFIVEEGEGYSSDSYVYEYESLEGVSVSIYLTLDEGKTVVGWELVGSDGKSYVGHDYVSVSQYTSTDIEVTFHWGFIPPCSTFYFYLIVE